MSVHPQNPAMDRRATQDHYDRLAASYDENWAYLASGRAALPHDRYDAVLLKEVLHHVGDRAGVIAGRAHPGERVTFTGTFAFVLGTAAQQ